MGDGKRTLTRAQVELVHSWAEFNAEEAMSIAESERYEAIAREAQKALAYDDERSARQSYGLLGKPIDRRTWDSELAAARKCLPAAAALEHVEKVYGPRPVTDASRDGKDEKR